jgi:hypothetical protein
MDPRQTKLKALFVAYDFILMVVLGLMIANVIDQVLIAKASF